MATSGSVQTNHIAATSRKWYWELIWSSSYNGNIATVNWDIYARCENGTSGSTWVANYGFGGNVNGTNLSFSGNFYKDAKIASGSFTIGGGNSFSASITAHPYSGSHTSSGNWTWVMDNKVVTPTVTCSVTRGLNTIAATMSVTDNGRANIVDRYIDLFTDSGCTNKVGTITGASGTFTGLQPNKTYYARSNASNGTYRGYSSVQTVSTYDIAKLTEAPDVNIGSAHTIKWTNPSGAATSLKLCKTDGTLVYNVGTVTGTSKSVTPTASNIYSLIPNDNSIKLRYVLTTTANGTSYTNTKDCTFKVTNSNPTFSDFTYQDTDPTTIALTGNNQIIINNYSNIKVTISTSNKAVAKNSATMKSYKLASGTKNVSKNYSSSADVELSLNDVDSATITVYATDSRGNSTSKAKTATFKNYTDLAITRLAATRQQNGVGSAVLLEFEGTYWNNSFGAVTNVIQQCIYKYKLASSSTWINGETQLSYSASNGKFSGSMLIKGDLGTDGFNIANAYNIRLQMADKLVTKAVDITLPSGAPGLAIAKKGLAIKQKYNNDLGGALQVNGIIYALDSDTGNFIDIVEKIKELASK